jgi:UDP-4-amino-4,6-dideoxy-N-acetyl-beta-L-altrosamine N-acetyltransferase
MPLRPLIEKDLDLVLSWRNAPEVRLHMFTTHVIGKKEHREWFRKISSDLEYRCYVHHTENCTADGVVSFSDIDTTRGTAQWGFYVDPAAPPGTGSKLGADALAVAFGDLGLKRLDAEVLETNERSIRFHEKLGFRNEGKVRIHQLNGRDEIGVYGFYMLDEDWAMLGKNGTDK